MKLLGMILILTASTLGGFAASGEAARHLQALRQVQELLQLLMGEIRCTYAPFPEAFRHIRERSPAPWNTFLEEMAGELEAYRGQGIAAVWMTAVEHLPRECGLNSDDRKELARLGSGLGYLDTEVQLATIGQFLSGWQGRREAAERDLKPRQKIYRCLGISLGITLVLILL